MATTPATSGNKKNDGSCIAYGGAVPATARNVTSVQGLTFAGATSHGNPVVPAADSDAAIAAGTAYNGTYKALAAGDYGSQRAGQYIMARVTTLIANAANTSLKFMGSAQQHPIHFIQSRRTTFLYSYAWTANRENSPTYAAVRVNTLNTYANDVAAHPTLAIPGKFVIMETGAAPAVKAYSAKTD